MSIDLQSLINEVLGMVREGQKNRAATAGNNWYGGNKDEEDYWKDIRQRNTALEHQGLVNQGGLAERNATEAGALARQKLMDETELSKQSLANQGASGIANIGAGWENRRTDSLLEGTKYTADVGKEKILGGTPEEQAQLNFRALIRSPWAKDRTPEEIQQAYSSMTSGKNHVEPSPEQGLKPVGGTIQTQTTPAPAPQTITNPAPTTSNTPGILDAVGSALNPRFIPQSHSYTAPLSQMTAAPGIAPMLNSPSEIAKNRANLDQATKDAQQEEEKRKKNKKNLSTGFNF